MKFTKKLTAVLLLCAVLAASLSCGNEPSTGTDTSAADSSDGTTAAAEPEYSFPADYEGYTFRILNVDDIYSMHATITRENATGEVLDDAMYDRSLALEEKMGVKLDETVKASLAEVRDAANTAILSGDDEYDVIYIPANHLQSFTEQDMLVDLKSLDKLKLDEDWWLGSFNAANTIGGKLYSAAGYSQLMIVDSLWCVYFNEDMMGDLGLTLPYDEVRKGTWTLDKLYKLQQAGANLNGDESFGWNDNGKCIYGLAGGAAERFMNGTGEMLLANDDGKLSVTYGSERFYNVISSLAANMKLGDGRTYNNYKSGLSDDTPGNYINVFETERSLLLTAEICKSVRMRNKEFTFGIVPNPKFDESQEGYYASPFDGVPLFTIPVTCKNPERSAAIGDALTYLSFTGVWDTFRDVTLSSKGLRNDDSVEMLGIILDGAVPDIVSSFGIGKELRSAINALVQAGEDTAASAVAANDAAIKAAIAKVNAG